jgi:hypothetical protein
MHDWLILLQIAVPLIIGGFLGYEIGVSEGFRKGSKKSFNPFYEEGYFNGWVARHNKLPLENRRYSPEEIQKLCPSLLTPSQDISDWQRNGDIYSTISEYRQKIINELNQGVNN